MGSARPLAVGIALSLFAACTAPEGDLPSLDERTLSFLDEGVDRVSGEVEEARAALAQGDGEAALERLEAARRSLATLEGYYLPLLRARELVHLARHAQARGAPDEVRTLLGRVEEELAPAGLAEEGLAAEEVGRLLGEIRHLDLAAGSDSALSLLDQLERRLNNLALKGGLVIRPDSPAQ
jgi:hypothetical protein